MAVSYTQDDANRLRAAIARGVTQLRAGDEQANYRPLAEMRSILAEIEAATGTAAPRQHYPQFMERPR
jgi:hypothetical protein